MQEKSTPPTSSLFPSMPLVLEPGANVRVREKAEIVTTQLQLEIWLCLRKMCVEEPPTDQGTLGAFLKVMIMFFFHNLLGVTPVFRILLNYIRDVWMHNLNPRNSFCLWYLNIRASAFQAAVNSLTFFSGSISVWGLGIQFWCGTTGLSGSLPDRAEIITKNNDQTITTYASYPFSRTIAECGRGLAQDLLEVGTVWFELRRVLGWYCFGYLLGSMYLGLELNQTGTNRQTNKTKQNKTKQNKQTNKQTCLRSFEA